MGHDYYRRLPPGRFDVGGYRQGFLGMPGWRSYGTFYGLPPALMGIPVLDFLQNGLLVGSYVGDIGTVYVYVVEVNGIPMEYRVDAFGNVLSVRPIQ